jgi:AcrR family transcriptional regulator
MPARRPRQPKRKDPNRHHHGDLRTALLDAAWLVLHEQGLPAVTIREVAERVGVTPMATYHHFANKASLIAAVAERGFESLRREILRRMAEETTPLLKLRAMGMGYAVFAVRHPDAFRIMFGDELADTSAHPELRREARQTMELVVGAFQGARSAGSIAPVEPPDAALTAWTAMHGLATLLIAGQLGPVTEENAERVAKVVLDGLRQGLRLPGT